MTKRSDWECRKGDQRIAKDADETEFSAIQYGRCNLDAGIRDDIISGENEDFVPQIEVDEWAESDMELDDAYSPLASEIERRQSILGEYYPFVIEGNLLVYRPSKTLAYELCLAISCSTSLTKGDFANLPRAFEHLTLAVVLCYLGQDSWGIRIGWPQQSGRINSFKELANHLYDSTNEWEWSPDVGYPDSPSVKDVKDSGLDFMVAKLFNDGRKGQLFLVGQCACGNNWDNKYYDLTVEKLNRWFRCPTIVPFVKVFSIPFHIANPTGFSDTCRFAGIALDRARIVRLAENPENHGTITNTLENGGVDTQSLIRLVISNFQSEQSGF